jgi:aspartokinase-like uncharacterized kinase
MKKRPVVIKVGGSLLTLKALTRELDEFLDQVGTHQVVLLTGGGLAVKALRQMKGKARLSDELAHWQCIRLMSDLTRSLSEQLPNSVAVKSWDEVETAWKSDRYPCFMVESYLRSDEEKKDHLPHSWDVSSDSIAAHLAARHKADLILLKACELPTRQVKAETLVKKGIVDAWFPQAVKKVRRWAVRNLPGGTAPEIALDLTAMPGRGRSRRKPSRVRR